MQINVKKTKSNTFYISKHKKNKTAYVRSDTVTGDAKHSTGAVLSEIVLGNIPVKNGVVHFIYRPLMVIDTTVQQFLEVSIITFSIFISNCNTIREQIVMHDKMPRFGFTYS